MTETVTESIDASRRSPDDRFSRIDRWLAKLADDMSRERIDPNAERIQTVEERLETLLADLTALRDDLSAVKQRALAEITTMKETTREVRVEAEQAEAARREDFEKLCERMEALVELLSNAGNGGAGAGIPREIIDGIARLGTIEQRLADLDARATARGADTGALAELERKVSESLLTTEGAVRVLARAMRMDFETVVEPAAEEEAAKLRGGTR